MSQNNDPQSVADYLAKLNKILITQRGRIQGEVSSLKPSGKALYFTIKDKSDSAQLDCMIWLNVYQVNGIELKVGDEIIVTGFPEIYAPYGRFSFKVNTIEYEGEGKLKQEYEKLKSTLKQEGLFEVDRKRTLPLLPTKIGVITSMQGAVIKDFTTNIGRHGFKILAVDSRVEGKDAIHELLAALNTMSTQDIEVLTIIRGGGSWESLQAFNTESVIRAISDFKVPVITGIGHDSDITLSQLVADYGASTPTAVAEVLNEPWKGLQESLKLSVSKLMNAYKSAIYSKRNTLQTETGNIMRRYEQNLGLIRTLINSRSTKIEKLYNLIANRVRSADSRFQKATAMMRSAINTKRREINDSPSALKRNFTLAINRKNVALNSTTAIIIENRKKTAAQVRDRLLVAEKMIKSNDPSKILKKGFSLTYRDNKLVRSIKDLSKDATIITNLSDGQAISNIKEIMEV